MLSELNLKYLNQDLKMKDDYWKESKQTKIIYQRDGKHYVFDGREEKQIVLRMSQKKKD